MSNKTRSINTGLWTDDKVSNDFTPEDKFFWLYLLTNTNTNTLGAYKLSVKETAFYMGLSDTSINNLIVRFDRYHDLIEYDYRSNELYIKNWYKYNWNTSKTLRTSLIRQANEITSKKVKELVLKDLASFYNQSVKDIKEEPEQPKKKAKKRRSGEYSEEFELFWKVYPRKVNKGSAYNAFKKLDMTDELLNEIITKVNLLVANNWKNTEVKYIPHASTWLNADGWLDEVISTDSKLTGKQRFEQSKNNAGTIVL